METVSIIMPVYNAERYLCEAIESVLKQTYSKFELLLINDNSTDRSQKICMEYSKKDSRIVLLENNCQIHGPGPTRNIGLEHATGEYIFFLDADDWIDERLLECAIAYMQETMADVVQVGVIHENGADALRYSWKGKSLLRKADIERDFPSCWKGIYTFLWIHLFRFERIKNVRFKNIINGEDLCYLMDALSRVETMAFVDEVYYHYRYVPDSTSHRWNRDMISCRGDIWEHQRCFLDSLPGHVDPLIYAGVAYENYTWALRQLSMNSCKLSYREKKRELSELKDRMDFDSYRGIYSLQLQHGLLRLKYMIVKYHLEGIILLFGSLIDRVERAVQSVACKFRKES